MRKFNLALEVSNIEESVAKYNQRFGQQADLVIPGKYALWRTSSLNISIRKIVHFQTVESVQPESKGAGVQGCRGAGEQGSRGAREQGNPPLAPPRRGNGEPTPSPSQEGKRGTHP